MICEYCLSSLPNSTLILNCIFCCKDLGEKTYATLADIGKKTCERCGKTFIEKTRTESGYCPRCNLFFNEELKDAYAKLNPQYRFYGEEGELID